MKKFNLLLIAFMATGILTAQSEWNADGAHSSVEFEITHLMISTTMHKSGVLNSTFASLFRLTTTGSVNQSQLQGVPHVM